MLLEERARFSGHAAPSKVHTYEVLGVHRVSVEEWALERGSGYCEVDRLRIQQVLDVDISILPVLL